MSKMKTKKETLKSRGIRFSDAQWNNITKDAKKDRTGRTTPSDVVRHIVDEHYEEKKKPQ